MTFVEFCEELSGHKLQEWQKEFLEKYYEAYERGSLIYMARGRTKGSRLLTQSGTALGLYLECVEKEDEKMIKYRLLHMGSDCTGPYDVTISLPMTVGEFISELLKTYPNEWGYIGIYKENELFGYPRCEYRSGKLLSTIPKEYIGMQIESVYGSGGWSCSDYILHIKKEDK